MLVDVWSEFGTDSSSSSLTTASMPGFCLERRMPAPAPDIHQGYASGLGRLKDRRYHRGIAGVHLELRMLRMTLVTMVGVCETD